VTTATNTESATVADTQTGLVIPFPKRSAPATRRIPLITASQPQDPDRLRRALDSLNAALADQRAALKVWRSAMGELKESTAALEDSLQRYRGNLRSLSGSVTSLRETVRSLENWADKAQAGVRRETERD
jgi:ABC-type transporter Mla subunit MlaD